MRLFEALLNVRFCVLLLSSNFRPGLLHLKFLILFLDIEKFLLRQEGKVREGARV